MPSPIDVKYAALIGANPWIGAPTSAENVCPDGTGHYRHYQGNSHGGASIYWHPATGAHLIYGFIRSKWAALGWERSPHGYPTTDESEAQSNQGRYNNFQNGTVIWKAGASAAFSVHGAIYGKWGDYHFDGGDLGFPVTDETGTPDGIGRYNHFEGGSVYWTPDTGAHLVKGAIRAAWASQGWEKSRLQYPISDELVTDGTGGAGRNSLFEGGEIYWTPQSGTRINLYPTAVVSRSSNDFSAGKVDAHQIWAKLSSDGTWQFHATFHDNSTFYGDSFALAFILDGDGHGAVITGTLGASLSGPSVDADDTRNGTDPWIEEYWHKVTRLGYHFHLHVSDDPASALSSLLGDLVKYAPSLIAFVA